MPAEASQHAKARKDLNNANPLTPCEPFVTVPPRANPKRCESVSDCIQIGEPRRLSQARVERAKQQIAQIVSAQSALKEFSSGAAQPIFSVALLEALFQQGFQNSRLTVWVVPNQMFRVIFRQIFLEDSVLGVQLAPQLGARVRRDDGDLRDVEFH